MQGATFDFFGEYFIKTPRMEKEFEKKWEERDV